ncbi:MAG TPA: hypothetical protein VMT17_09835 [Anaeromyxobacteraceae bacterium]|nr:hypothetical protein [Anaeromyxobacteraceae bacterium]
MSLFDALSVVACAGALALLFDAAVRGPGVAAAVAAGLQALVLFHAVQIRAGGFPVTLVLAGGIAIAGGVAWARASAKPAVTGATAATLAAAVQLLVGSKLL